MKINKLGWRIAAISIALGASMTLFTACRTADKKWTKHSDKTGAQLWAENCMRCHNFRSPGSQSDDGWEVSMHHMRERAGLTGVEHRKILAFLQSSN